MSVDFTLDLNDAANATLKTPGGYLVTQGVIVAFTKSSQYIAVAAACTHEGRTVNYNANNNNFVCPAHGATFSSTGGATGGPANGDLQKMNTSLSGTSLRIYS